MVDSPLKTIQPSPPRPARERLIQTADDLFSNEGVHSVGVDRIIAEARVTKATFYKHFPSKESLIVAYIEYRHERVAELVDEVEARYSTPEAVLLRLVDDVTSVTVRPGFRGCPFLNTSALFADEAHPVRLAISRHRDWFTEHLEQIFARLEHPYPGDAADEFILARDGALSGAQAGDPIAANAALRRAVDRVLRITVQLGG